MFSLVDKRAGFSINPKVVGSNPGSVNFPPPRFFFKKYIESVLGSNPPHFFNFLNVVQYLFVHCTVPSILGLHPPYPTSPPTPNIAFISTLTPTTPSRPDPPPPPMFVFEFSQKLQFFVHIHPHPPNPTPQFFLFNFHKTSLLRSHLP